MKKIILFVFAVLMLAACGDKKPQNTSGGESADSTKVSVATDEGQAEEEDDGYDLKAIAKAIEGCEDLGSFSDGLAGVKKNGKVGYIDM